jgi:penicillin-insensitive murein endopeptidase
LHITLLFCFGIGFIPVDDNIIADMRLIILLIAALPLAIIQYSDETLASEIGISESIGSYTSGCIRNSATLSIDGDGYQVIRLGRGRYYGNPEIITYIESLSKKVKKELNGTLLIADISQQTGGPILDDHSSHQIGLDADILLWQHPIARNRTLTITEREHIHPQSVLTFDEMRIDEFKWNPIHGEIIKLAASDTRVERIFINPVIKRRLCSVYPGELWLGKTRPWYGHDGHFHVRLRCPEENSLCESQKPIEISGDGCGSDLNSWFRADGSIKRKRKSVPSTQKRLPKECKPIMYPLGEY